MYKILEDKKNGTPRLRVGKVELAVYRALMGKKLTALNIRKSANIEESSMRRALRSLIKKGKVKKTENLYEIDNVL